MHKGRIRSTRHLLPYKRRPVGSDLSCVPTLVQNQYSCTIGTGYTSVFDQAVVIRSLYAPETRSTRTNGFFFFYQLLKIESTFRIVFVSRIRIKKLSTIYFNTKTTSYADDDDDDDGQGCARSIDFERFFFFFKINKNLFRYHYYRSTYLICFYLFYYKFKIYFGYLNGTDLLLIDFRRFTQILPNSDFLHRRNG